MAAAAAVPPVATTRTTKRTRKTKTPNMKAVIHSPLMKARKRLQNSTPGSAARQIAGLVDTVYDTPRRGASLRGNLARDLCMEVTCPRPKGKASAQFLDVEFMKDGPFAYDKVTREPLGHDGRSNLWYAKNKMKEALNSAGSLEHQAVLIQNYAAKVEPDIGRTLGLVEQPCDHWAAAEEVLTNSSNFLAMTKNKKSNDAIGARNTVLLALCGPAPLDTAPKEQLKEHRKRVERLAKELNLSKAQTKKALEMSTLRRDMFTSPDTRAYQFLQTHMRNCWGRKNTPELRKAFQIWLYTICHCVIASPSKKDELWVKDPITGEKTRVRKYYYSFSLREIFNAAIKDPREGGFAGFRDPKNPSKVWISMATMQRMMPKNLRRMTDSQKKMCGCELCIDARSCLEALIEFRRKRVRHLTSLVDGLRTNSEGVEPETIVALKEVKDEYTEFNFESETTDDGHTKLTPKVDDVTKYVDSMSCRPCGSTSFCHYNCCLGRCGNQHMAEVHQSERLGHDEAMASFVADKAAANARNVAKRQESAKGKDAVATLAEKKANAEALTQEAEEKRGQKLTADTCHSDELICWKMHHTTYHCELHGMTPQDGLSKSVCQECESLKEADRPKERPKSKLERVQMRRSIGEFHFILEKFINDSYRQHQWLIAACGGAHCVKHREPERLMLLDPDAVFITRDYTDRISVECNNEAMTAGMGGGKSSVGMEGFLYNLKDKESGDIELNWMGYLSDWKQQDSRTSFLNLHKFILKMREERKLVQPNSTLYVRSDGCPAQYKCGTALQLVQLLADRFNIQIDWMVTAPHHGKNLVDAIAGRDKYDLCNGFIRGLDDAQRDEFFKALSEA